LRQLPISPGMSDESPEPAGGSLMSRGTPQSNALGIETSEDGGVMRVPFRADLVGDLALGGLADGVIVTLLDQACGYAISAAVMARTDMAGRELRMGAMATLDFRIDYVRPARAGMGVTARAECLKIEGEVAFVRGEAFEEGPGDPVAIVQAAFMLSGVPTAA
jgi:acyl-coenzyme A thioesterase PaaI-like protein